MYVKITQREEITKEMLFPTLHLNTNSGPPVLVLITPNSRQDFHLLPILRMRGLSWNPDNKEDIFCSWWDIQVPGDSTTQTTWTRAQPLSPPSWEIISGA